MLSYLKKVTLTPDDVTAEDARALRQANISTDAAVEARYVCFLFNAFDRLADALGWEVPPPEVIQRAARMMLKRGYEM